MRIKLTFLNSNMALCNISEIIPRLLIGVILNLLFYFFSFQKHLGYHWIFSTALLTLEALFTYYERESERISRSVVSSSLRPHVLWPTRLLCPWGFSRQEYWSGLPCPLPEDRPSSGIEPRSPALQADSLPSEPPGKQGTCTLSNPHKLCDNE